MRKWKLMLVLVLILPADILFSQEESTDTAMIAKIREEGMNHSQVKWIAHQITDIAGSRLTNSPGYHRAADWIKGLLQQWGLVNVKLEPWGEFGYGWSVERSYAAMKSPYYANFISYPSPWSGGTDGLKESSVFLIEKMDSAYITQHADQIKGHIVIALRSDSVVDPNFKADASRYSDSALEHMTDQYMISRQMINMFLPQLIKMVKIRNLLFSTGALALLEMSDEAGDGAVFVDGFGGYGKRDQPALPKLILEKEDYLRLQRLLLGGTPVKIELDIRTKYYGDDLNGYNVVAEIPGTDHGLKAQLVMLGGHLDSWQSATGATDNGAGCIVALEAIRILKSLHIQPKRTIRIALWGGEEQGLIGSFNYVKNHFGDPQDMKLKPEQKLVSAYYNLDNGTGKIRGIFNQGNEQVNPIFTKWLEPFHDLGAATVTPHNTGSTDHLSFDAVGIPGFQFIQDPLDYETRTHHSNFDTYDHLEPDDLKQASTILAAFVYNTAMRNAMLPRKPIPIPEKFIFDGLLPD
jgi:hypothetical protein